MVFPRPLLTFLMDAIAAVRIWRLDFSLTVARNLSAAINQSKGMNVSQYVNGFRLAHAATSLRETQLSVTEIAALSGFLSRSNFYREFQRSYGQSPVTYRQGPSE